MVAQASVLEKVLPPSVGICPVDESFLIVPLYLERAQDVASHIS